MPVPIVTLNHDGLKFRTMRRHPLSYFDSGRRKRSDLVLGSFDSLSLVVEGPLLGEDAHSLMVRCLREDVATNVADAGILIAGLLLATRSARSSSSSIDDVVLQTVTRLSMLLSVRDGDEIVEFHLDCDQRITASTSGEMERIFRVSSPYV